jgi:hypothetical protein
MRVIIILAILAGLVLAYGWLSRRPVIRRLQCTGQVCWYIDQAGQRVYQRRTNGRFFNITTGRLEGRESTDAELEIYKQAGRIEL